MSQPGEVFNFKGGCCSCSFLFFLLGVVYIVTTLVTATMPVQVGSHVEFIDTGGEIYNNMCYLYEGTVEKIDGDYAIVRWTSWRTFSQLRSSNKSCNLVRKMKIDDLDYDEEDQIADHGGFKYWTLSIIFFVIAVIVIFAIMSAVNSGGRAATNYLSGNNTGSSGNDLGGFTPR